MVPLVALYAAAATVAHATPALAAVRRPEAEAHGAAHGETHGAAHGARHGAARATTCFAMAMVDSYGDGWNGDFYNVTALDGAVVATGTLAANFTGTDDVCLADGDCYALTVGGGFNPEEHSWSLGGLGGGSPASVFFGVGGGGLNAAAAGACGETVEGDHCFAFEMSDSLSDGWDGTLYQFDALPVGTLEDGDARTYGVCLRRGCHALSIFGGNYHEEHSWKLAAADGGPLAGEEAAIPLGETPFAADFFVSADGAVTWGSCDTAAPTTTVAPTLSPPPTAAPTLTAAPTADGAPVASFQDLETIVAARATMTLVVTADILFERAVGIAADKRVDIVGAAGVQMPRLSGGYATRLFEVGGVLVLRHLVLEDAVAWSAGGGCVLVEGAGAVFEAYGVLARRNAAETGGFLESSEGTIVRLTNCTFINNTATAEGGLAITRGGYLRLDGSSVTGSTATDDCGAVSNVGGVAELVRSTLARNGATYYGGAVCSSYGAQTDVEDCLFEDNSAELGGAIVSFAGGDYAVRGSAFRRNVATFQGGAVYDSGDTTHLAESSFEDNTAGDAGGAVFSVWGTLTLEDCCATGNIAGDRGGFLSREVSLVLLTASRDAGVAYSEQDLSAFDFLIDGGDFSHNEATLGGAFFVIDALVRVRGASVHSNRADRAGGGFFLKDAPATTFDGAEEADGGDDFEARLRSNLWAAHSFESGVAVRGNRALLGGGMFLQDAPNVIFDDSVVDGNDAIARGGGMYLASKLVRIAAYNGTLAGNVATEGSAVYSDTPLATVRLRGLGLRGNKAAKGTMYFTLGSEVTVDRLTSAENVARVGGIAFVGPDSTFRLANATSAGDTALDRGLIFFDMDCTSIIERFHAHDADVGGCLVCGDSLSITVSDAVIARTTAEASSFLSVAIAKRVVLERCFFVDARVKTSCGVAFIDGGETTLRDVTIDGANGGVLCLRGGSVNVSTSTFRDNAGGVFLIDAAAKVAVASSTFSANRAPHGAVARVYDAASTFEPFNSTFEGNTARGDGGVVAVRVVAEAGGAAGGGGWATNAGRRLAAEDTKAEPPVSGFISRGANVFRNNTAGRGAVLMLGSGAFGSFDATDAAVVNFARGGGGVSFFLHDAAAAAEAGHAATFFARAAPVAGLDSMALRDNGAAYGPAGASDPVRMSTVHSRTELSNVVNEQTVVVAVVDWYGSTVTTFRDNANLALAARGQADVALSGALIMPFADGVATWPPGSFKLTFRPNATVSLAVTLDAAAHRTALDVYLRPCVVGEADLGAWCATCASGTYNVYAGATCSKCPKDADCRGGRDITASRRYWRQAWDSDAVRRCKFDDACEGGSVDLWGETQGNATAARGARAPAVAHVGATAQCTHHHAGPLCATCESGYQLDGSGVCGTCASSDSEKQRRITLVATLAALALVAAACCCRHGKWLQRVVAYAAKVAWFYGAILSSRLKVFLAFYQIMAALPACFPDMDWSLPMRGFFGRIAFVSLDFGLWSSVLCRTSFDILDKLLIATFLPFVAAVASKLLYEWPGLGTVLRMPRKRARALVALLFLVMTYTIYTVVSGIVIRALQCDDGFSASDNSPYAGGSFLYQDYTVSCHSRRYKLYRIYAICMIFVYPVGIPALYVAMLYKAKRHIAPADVKALAREIVESKPEIARDFIAAKRALGEEIEMLEREHKLRRSVGRDTALTRLADRYAYAIWAFEVDFYRSELRRVEHEAAVCRQASEYLRSHAKYLRSHAESAGPGAADDDYFESETTSITWRAEKQSIRVLGDHLVMAYREAAESSIMLKFLFEEYDPACWYFESLECVRRLLLTSVLPLSSMRSESLGQIVLICLVSLAFAGFYAHLRPFVSDSMDTFANIMQSCLFLNYFLTLVMFAEEHICDAVYKSNMRGAGFGIIFLSFCVAPLSGIGSIPGFVEGIGDFRESTELADFMANVARFDPIGVVSLCQRKGGGAAVRPAPPARVQSSGNLVDDLEELARSARADADTACIDFDRAESTRAAGLKEGALPALVASAYVVSPAPACDDDDASACGSTINILP